MSTQNNENAAVTPDQVEAMMARMADMESALAEQVEARKELEAQLEKAKAPTGAEWEIVGRYDATLFSSARGTLISVKVAGSEKGLSVSIDRKLGEIPNGALIECKGSSVEASSKLKPTKVRVDGKEIIGQGWANYTTFIADELTVI